MPLVGALITQPPACSDFARKPGDRRDDVEGDERQHHGERQRRARGEAPLQQFDHDDERQG
ncbi:MAG: hypothetical protein QM702_10570 [Rubrivivax sp.]